MKNENINKISNEQLEHSIAQMLNQSEATFIMAVTPKGVAAVSDTNINIDNVISAIEKIKFGILFDSHKNMMKVNL